MAYLEGLWIPNGTEVAGQFTCLARSFMGLEVFKDSSKGTEIFLLENPEQVAVKAIVVSLEEDRLFVRRVLFG
ncbi:MAG TPA: hypothetical protein VK364_05140 [Hymenobacter sp.]|nr:hypothetical protein [Hymenobacter sp.]